MHLCCLAVSTRSFAFASKLPIFTTVRLNSWTLCNYSERRLQCQLGSYVGYGCRNDSRSTQPIRFFAHVTRLTPQEATNILRKNEFTSGDLELENCSVKSFDTNTLASNQPSEDCHHEALLKYTSNGCDSLMFGVFDGHGGSACAQVVSKRLLHYVASGVLSIDEIRHHLETLKSCTEESQDCSLLKTFNDPLVLVSDLQKIFYKSYTDHVSSTLRAMIERSENDEAESSVTEKFVHAFKSLDEDLTSEALGTSSSGGSTSGSADEKLKVLAVALSGCVAAVAHVDGPMVHVASSGDCTAVIGSVSENDTWISKKLNIEHNADNKSETDRILSEHPPSEAKTIFKGDRLLGMLAPLRAFGDFRFKWPEKDIVNAFQSVLGTEKNDTVFPNYHTPPYLSVLPDVTSHRLSPRDKFLIIASDGLWDMMNPMQAVRLVGEHMYGKITLSPLCLSGQSPLTLDDINNLLQQRNAALKLKPSDSNAATHLIRCALGGTSYGVDHGRLSHLLSMPQDMVRNFRDDITITVIFFDSEYLRHC